ncbi:MAG: hypothetical protein MZU97_04895 [Bacillus subtilis]|nr:hypothetical protein [Bacillus subtilis]
MNDAVNIRIAGFGGQGVMMAGQLLAYAATDEELYGLWSPVLRTRNPRRHRQLRRHRQPSKPIHSPVFQKADHLLAFNASVARQVPRQRVKDGRADPLQRQPDSSCESLDQRRDDRRFRSTRWRSNSATSKSPTWSCSALIWNGPALFGDATIHKVLQVLPRRTKKPISSTINLKAIEAGRRFIRETDIKPCLSAFPIWPVCSRENRKSVWSSASRRTTWSSKPSRTRSNQGRRCHPGRRRDRSSERLLKQEDVRHEVARHRRTRHGQSRRACAWT